MPKGLVEAPVYSREIDLFLQICFLGRCRMLKFPMAFTPRKRNFPRALGEFVARTIDPVLAKQGFGEADVILHWKTIAGPRLSGVSEPVRLQWPVKAPNRPADAAPEPATLILRVEGAFALEFQHMAPLLVERINARLGWRCVGRIVLKQGPVGGGSRKPVKSVPSAGAVARAAETTGGVEDEALRDALTRLGAHVFTPQRAKT
jgi:hypothetical protein